jgi:hypothetical protein
MGSCNCDDNDEENSWRSCANLVQKRPARHHSTLRPARTRGHDLTIREDTIPISQQMVHNVGRSAQVRYAVVIRNEVSVTPQLKGGCGLSLRGVKSRVSRESTTSVVTGLPSFRGVGFRLCRQGRRRYQRRLLRSARNDSIWPLLTEGIQVSTNLTQVSMS